MKSFTYKITKTDLGHDLPEFDNIEVTSEILPQSLTRRYDHKIIKMVYTPQDSTSIDVTPLVSAFFVLCPIFEDKIMKIGQEFLEEIIGYYSPGFNYETV